MAQTRKRRQTKHRGNAAGMVEARGRTGRRPEDSERDKLDAKEEARRKRLERLDTPPTWRGALNRAAIAAALFGVLMIVIGNGIAAGVSLAAVMLLLYIPLSFYTDLMIYRRRQKKKAEGKASA
jgi:Flp pilus assembly protein TadB